MTASRILGLLEAKLNALSQGYSTFAKRLSKESIWNFINETTSHAVLILGRFPPEKKAVLDAITSQLSKYNYTPMLFDRPLRSNRNFTETISTLAHISRFIIADLTEPSSLLQELHAIVPILAIPVQPILLEGNKEHHMFDDLLRHYHWVLPIYHYKDQVDLLKNLKEHVIEPAERRAQELEKR
jgi:hypothetical protein